MPRRLLAPAAALLLFAGFAWGLFRVVVSRFETGDVYPAYSSLRSDPRGTRVLYEALARLPRLSVRRGYTPLAADARAAATVAFVAGCDPLGWQSAHEPDLAEVERFLSAGGRVVLAFSPLVEDPGFERALGMEAAARRAESRKPKARARRDAPRRVTLRERWGVAFRFEPLANDDAGTVPAVAARAVDEADLPRSLPWRTGILFDRLSPAWTVLYARNGRPVMVRRAWGRGTLVLSSDSSFLSNEAQRLERRPELVAALVGPAEHVLFDETHLGVSERTGVMTLVRRYRLHGILLSLLAVASLFLWRSAASFLPRHEDAPLAAVAGQDAGAGLTNLLRRGIPPGALLAACIAEWERSAPPGAPVSAVRALAARAPSGEKGILSAYRRIASLADPRAARTKGAA